MKLTLKSNTLDFTCELLKRKDALPIVGSETVNTAAKYVKQQYEKEIDKFTLRNKFTKGSIKLQLSKPMRSKGGARNLSDINATIGVMKLKGGKDHYLKYQEEGHTKGGSVGGKVPIPMDSARTGNSQRKGVKGALKLQAGKIQTLNFAGKPFGAPNDGYNAGFRPGAQRWAILYKYTGLSGRGKVNATSNPSKYIGRYGWDLTKQFFFTGLKIGYGAFALVGKRITGVRTLEHRTVKIEATHKFENANSKLTPVMMEAIFKRAANKFIK